MANPPTLHRLSRFLLSVSNTRLAVHTPEVHSAAKARFLWTLDTLKPWALADKLLAGCRNRTAFRFNLLASLAFSRGHRAATMGQKSRLATIAVWATNSRSNGR